MEEGSEDSGLEENDTTKEINVDIKIPESSVPIQAEPVTVGAALRNSNDTGFNIVSRPRKRRKVDKASWRECLENSRGKLSEDAEAETDGSDSDSDSISSLSDETEYSDWGGISPYEEPDSVAEDNNGDKESQDSNSEFESSQSDEESDSDSEESSGTDDNSEKERQAENVRRLAKGFTTWARQQSGFGETISNIDSLPQLTPEQRKAIIAANEAAKLPSLPPTEPVPTHQVTLFFTNC